METTQKTDKLAYWPNTTKQFVRWVIDQLTVLAVAFGSPMDVTAERLEIYAANLTDLDRTQLEIAFTRARRECRFFPKIAELRELAGTAAKDVRNIEAEAAWKFANDYLRKWGVDLMPIYSGGQRIEAPCIPPRIAYALRRIGGLHGLNQITEENRPFMFKDFCEAYNLAPIADALAPQLADEFPVLEGHVKQLGDGTKTERETEKPSEARFKPKPFPNQYPLTDAQRADRREMLRQQTETLLRQRTAGDRIEGTPNPRAHSDSHQVGTRGQARA